MGGSFEKIVEIFVNIFFLHTYKDLLHLYWLADIKHKNRRALSYILKKIFLNRSNIACFGRFLLNFLKSFKLLKKITYIPYFSLDFLSALS